MESFYIMLSLLIDFTATRFGPGRSSRIARIKLLLPNGVDYELGSPGFEPGIFSVPGQFLPRLKA